MTNILPETAVPHPHVYTVDVTPELAQSWLDSSKSNRTVSEYQVQKLTAQMQAGQWRLNHNGIAFAKDGTLLDGLHRLHAVVHSGVTVPMIVVVDEPIENMDVIDNRHLNK
jgi:ABC-type molybdenum transport system ATPase subunit/photorepair protein PhrA